MIAIDTETTDLLKPQLSNLKTQPYIIEFCAVKLDAELNIIDELEFLMKPPLPIPEFITKLTGIDDNKVKDAKTFIEHYEQIANFFLGETEVLGHNVEFDLGVMLCELMRHDLEYKFPWPMKHICTVEMSMPFASDPKYYNRLSKPLNSRRLKLTQLHEIAFGREPRASHRAKDDVYSTIRCYDWLVGELS